MRKFNTQYTDTHNRFFLCQFFGIYNYIVITAKALNKNSYLSKDKTLHIVVWLFYTMQQIIKRLRERE